MVDNRKTITDDKTVDYETSESVEVVPSFQSMRLRDDLLQGIYAYGFGKPSALQQKLIVPIASGKDVFAQASSGAGKTATFAIAVLQRLDITLRDTQVLCLSPTRELAVLLQKMMLRFGDLMNVQCHACIGGTSLGADVRKFDYGQHVVSGTPGRVLDMIHMNHLKLNNIKVFVLDDADEMTSSRFVEQVDKVYRSLPPATQVVIMCKKYPYKIFKMMRKYMTDPTRIQVNHNANLDSS